MKLFTANLTSTYSLQEPQLLLCVILGQKSSNVLLAGESLALACAMCLPSTREHGKCILCHVVHARIFAKSPLVWCDGCIASLISPHYFCKDVARNTSKLTLYYVAICFGFLDMSSQFLHLVHISLSC